MILKPILEKTKLASEGVIPDSNLGPVTRCLDRNFLWFSSVSPDKCLDGILK